MAKLVTVSYPDVCIECRFGRSRRGASLDLTQLHQFNCARGDCDNWISPAQLPSLERGDPEAPCFEVADIFD